MCSGARESSQKLTIAIIAEFLFWPAQPSDSSLTLLYLVQSVELSASKIHEEIVSESLRKWFSVQQYDATFSLFKSDLLRPRTIVKFCTYI